MVTVLERNESTIIRDRSQFIGILVHVTNDKSVPDILKSIRNEYPKAKHYCYAYVIDGKKKCSDDGEPAKTAGRPLLELLEKKEMDEVLLVVVRYFGGVLLGASRLMSTYLETGVEVIRTCDLVNIENKFIYHMELTYSEFDCLKRLIKQTSMFLENIVYSDTISLDILCDENDGTLLTEWFPKSPIEVNGNKKVYRR